jgi:hypothetical protein
MLKYLIDVMLKFLEHNGNKYTVCLLSMVLIK